MRGIRCQRRGPSAARAVPLVGNAPPASFLTARTSSPTMRVAIKNRQRSPTKIYASTGRRLCGGSPQLRPWQRRTAARGAAMR
jgi:hypothetical protein